MKETESDKQSAGTKRHIATLCHVDQNCCPQVILDEAAPRDKQVTIMDDFGNSVLMSKDQMRSFIEQAREGKIGL